MRHWIITVITTCVLFFGFASYASADETPHPNMHHSVGGGIFFYIDSNTITPDLGLYISYDYRIASWYRMGLELSWGIPPIPLHGALRNDIIRVLFTHELEMYKSPGFIFSLRPELGYYAARYSPCDSLSCDMADWEVGEDQHYFHSFTAAFNVGFAWWVAECWTFKWLLGVGGWVGTTDYHDVFGGKNPESAVYGMLRLGVEYHW